MLFNHIQRQYLRYFLPLFFVVLTSSSIGAAQWQIQTVDTSIGDVGRDTSLALDSAGNPRISYFDASSLEVKYAFMESAEGDEIIVGGECFISSIIP
jgi:hypothetical protein